MQVVGYARVSTDEQAMDGVSLEVQTEKIRLYCQMQSLTLTEIIVDAGESGKDLDRPGIKQVFNLLDNHEVEGVAVAKLDRLSRSILSWGWLVEHYFGERAPAASQLFSVNDSIDTRTAAGRLVLNVLMCVFQWEREAIVERTREALAHKRARGETTGHPPYGRRLVEGGPVNRAGRPMALEPDLGEEEAVVLMKMMRAAGSTFRAIVAQLNADEVPTKRSGKPWTPGSVHAILRRRPDGS